MAEIYFDNNATTAMDERVGKCLIQELYLPLNASSPHLAGRSARLKLTAARQKIAKSLGLLPSQIVFTSGGTEAINLALRGLFRKKSHVVTSSAEHSCVLNTLRALYPKDQIDELDPGREGSISALQIAKHLRPDTNLIAITAANNETGIVTDLAPIADLAQKRRIDLVVDASCAFGKIEIDMLPGITALCFAGHKFHGPHGSGLICLHPKSRLIPQITGGPQEHQRRAGTENIPTLCALAEAIKIAIDELKSNQGIMLNCQRSLWGKLKQNLPEIELNALTRGLPNTLNIHFPKVSGQLLLALLDQKGVRASHGAACSSGLTSPSHVLLAMGYSPLRANRSLRFSLSKFTTLKEVELGSNLIIQAHNSLTGQ